MIRPRGAVRGGRDDEVQSHPSAEDIGLQLQGAREARGLDLLAVHDRLSRPITQIEALERGDLTRLQDRLAATSTLRRYATLLGLDGEELTKAFGQAWSAATETGAFHAGDGTGVVGRPARHWRPSRPARPPRPAAPAGRTGRPPHEPAPADTAEHLRAFTQTGEVPRFGVATRSPGGNGAGPPTGTFPVVPRHDLRSSRRALARARRRLRAPLPLRALTWLAAVCILLVAAGWAIRTWHPEWLVRAHILRTGRPGASGAAASGAAPTVPAPAPTPPRATAHGKAALQPTSSDQTSAAFTVATKNFTVSVATTGECWVQVLSSSSSVPLVSGVQPSGKVFSFKATGTMTVQVGSVASLVGVKVAGRNAYLNQPPAAPFTYTFAPPA